MNELIVFGEHANSHAISIDDLLGIKVLKEAMKPGIPQQRHITKERGNGSRF